MGTWSEGLFDSDAALEQLADCLRIIDLEADAAHMAIGLGLHVWMLPSQVHRHASSYLDLIDRHPDWLDALPLDAQAALNAFESDPESFVEGGLRQAELRDVLGGYSAGPRHDALLTLPDAGRVLGDIADQIAMQLDDVFQGDKTLGDMAASLARLGPLLQLAVAGMWAPDSRRVHAWRQLFEEANARTHDNRPFWDRYVARIRKGFDLLARLGWPASR